MKKLKNKFSKKKLVIALVSIMASLIVVFAIYCYMSLTQLFIPYNDALISIDEIDGKLYANYQGNTRSGTLCLDPSTVSLNGEEKDIAAFCFYESLWSKYITPIFSGHNTARGEESTFI